MEANGCHNSNRELVYSGKSVCLLQICCVQKVIYVTLLHKTTDELKELFKQPGWTLDTTAMIASDANPFPYNEVFNLVGWFILNAWLI